MNEKFANKIGYSDIEPYEIIEKRTPKKLIIRSMNTKPNPEFIPEFIPGGFSAHCTNQNEQKWFYESNNNGYTFAIRKHKSGKWKDTSGSEYRLNEYPVKFYDYNF